MHGCRMNKQPITDVFSHPDSFLHLQFETDEVSLCLIHIIFGVWNLLQMPSPGGFFSSITMSVDMLLSSQETTVIENT